MRREQARMEREAGGQRSGWRDLLASIWSYDRRGMIALIAIVLMASLVEGLGLALLLPMAALLLSTTANGSPYVVFVADLLAGLGQTDTLAKLVILGAGFIVWMVLRSALLLYSDYRQAEFINGYIDSLRVGVFASLAQTPWAILKSSRKSDFMASMTTDVPRLTGAVQALVRLLVTVTLTLAYLATAVLVSPATSALLGVVVLLASVIALAGLRRSRLLGGGVTGRNRDIASMLTVFLDGLKTAKAVRAEERFIRDFASRVRALRELQVAFKLQQGRMRRAIELLGAVLLVALLVIGFGIFRLAPVELLLLLGVILRLIPSLLGAISGMQQVAFALPALGAAEVQHRFANSGKDTTRAERAVVQPGTAPIELSGMRLYAPNGDRLTPLLSVEHLTLPPTGLVLVRGPSGAGKSTFAELLAGLYLPDAGWVRCAGLFLDHSGQAHWQARVAFAPQEPYLFAASLRENLLWPDLTCDDARIWDALAIAEADNLMRSVPEGLDLPLLDGGSRLSGGERQRLCLARALLRQGSVLIIDEATSAVDRELEDVIYARLRKVAQDKLVVCISHSPSVAGMAAMIVNVSPDGLVTRTEV